GGGGGFGGGGGIGFALLPFVFSRFGCGGVVVLGIALLVFGGLGNIGSMLSSVGGAPTAQVAPGAGSGGTTAAEICNSDPLKLQSCHMLASLNQTWPKLIQGYTPPKLSFYSQEGQSGCGVAQSAMGPFYCPTDGKVYLDVDFYKELQNRFGAAGDFAQDYVVAHEVGHHIQNLTGTADKVREAQANASRVEGNALSVKLELQADCYAGVWAARNRDRMEAGDLEEGMRAAQAIGDDTLQRESQGVVVPESFTHGTSAQRQFWLKKGLDSGDPAQCDTFGAGANA
ncbi:MAG: zinc metallopeptidase, partial [Sphingomonadaceae bacterium]|nr:zinc metallopeptidase [Sphingomonadaceae bacterium]